jgi:hypothetical protein
MEDKVIISIIEREEGLEVRLGENAYGNLPIIGLLEKIKLNLLSEPSDERTKEIPFKPDPNKKYDA